MNLQPGDTIERVGEKLTVIDTSKNGNAVYALANGTYCHPQWLQVSKLIENGYTKKETSWTPEDGEDYYFMGGMGDILCDRWEGLYPDKGRASFLGVFPTKEAALKRKEEIIKLIRK